MVIILSRAVSRIPRAPSRVTTSILAILSALRIPIHFTAPAIPPICVSKVVQNFIACEVLDKPNAISLCTTSRKSHQSDVVNVVESMTKP